MHRLLAILALAARASAAGKCNEVTLDFVMLDSDPQQAAIEADIAADLEVVGIKLNKRVLDKEAFNAATLNGDFDMVFSETWGAPYDAHSYVASWTAVGEGHQNVLKMFPEGDPLSPDTFAASVADVLSEQDAAVRQDKWTQMLTDIHTAVIHLPLWGKRIPSVTSRARLEGYSPGHQQFDYPIHKARVAGTGPKTIKVSPGAQTGLFQSVGRLDPHSYRPNEFFSNGWVYEGLTAYGANGAVEPSLATKWEVSTNAAGGDTYRFTLREGVKFHDGAMWDCSVAKLNFDHVWAGGLVGGDWHGWYGLPGALSEWSCDGEVFVVSTSIPYYPLLQELTYIRPCVMLSPNAFMNGPTTDPFTDNSCPAGWGDVVEAGKQTVKCVGTKGEVGGAEGIVGTGPFKFASRTPSPFDPDTPDDLVVFEGNADYWGGAPDIEELHVVRYADSAAVYAALDSGELDAVLGAGVLDPADVKQLQYDNRFDTLHGDETQTVAIIMNIDDENIRKTVVHAVNKVPIIKEQLSGFESPTGQLFSRNAPYCDVDLTPKFDYDLEKAQFLNCPEGGDNDDPTPPPGGSKKKKSSSNSGTFIGLFVAAAVLALLAICGACYMMQKEKAGEPVFAPVKTANPVQEKATA